MVIRDRSFRIDNSTNNSHRVVVDLTLDCSNQSEADDILRFLERMANPILESSHPISSGVSGAPLVDRRSGAVINSTPRYDPEYRVSTSRNNTTNGRPIIASPINRSENIEDVNEYSNEPGNIAREIRVDDDFNGYRNNNGAGDGYVENAPSVFIDRPIPRNAIIAGEEMAPSIPVNNLNTVRASTQPELPVVTLDVNPITDLDID